MMVVQVDKDRALLHSRAAKASPVQAILNDSKIKGM